MLNSYTLSYFTVIFAQLTRLGGILIDFLYDTVRIFINLFVSFALFICVQN